MFFFLFPYLSILFNSPQLLCISCQMLYIIYDFVLCHNCEAPDKDLYLPQIPILEVVLQALSVQLEFSMPLHCMHFKDTPLQWQNLRGTLIPV